MKLRDLYKVNSRRALLVSIFVHLSILTLLATATLQLTTPEGYVLDGEIELSAPGAGEPTPIEVAPAIPKGTPEVVEKKPPEKTKKDEDVVEVPMPPAKKEAKIEKQKVDVKPKPAPVKTPKAWIPVEETDVADGEVPVDKSEDNKPSDESENSEAKTSQETSDAEANEAKQEKPEEQGQEANEQAAARESAPSAGADDGEEPEIIQQGGNAAGQGMGPVRSASVLKELPGNPRPYPYLARVQRIEGVAVVRFILRPNGQVAKIWLHKSSGSQILDKSAVETLAKWKWNYVSGADGVFEKKMVYVLSGPAELAPYQK